VRLAGLPESTDEALLVLVLLHPPRRRHSLFAAKASEASEAYGLVRC
jgi:hypothetical protein